MTPAPHRLFVFDCDGTLVDSQANIVSIMDEAFSRHGLASPGAGRIRRQVGLSLEHAIARVLPEDSSGALGDLVSTYRAIARDRREAGAIEEPLYPGIRELIEALEAPSHFLAVATGKHLIGLEHTLAIHSLAHRFHSLQTADKCRGKPDPDMVLKAMAETATLPGDTIVIGDTTFDMEMARAAGATAIGVAWGYHEPRDLEDAGAHCVIGQPLDLLRQISLG